jgi:DNA polymerase-3 subunit epsilon
MKFLAIDFETANYFRNSACAIGLVLVENNEIIEKRSYLIKPPQKWFVFTDIHGLTWDDVKDEPTFDIVWEKIKHYWEGIDFVVAHNSSFDSSVLRACCDHYSIKSPNISFHCTVRISRQLWGIHPTKLPDVCSRFKIPLNHHDALSDTLACAQIMIQAIKDGYEF